MSSESYSSFQGKLIKPSEIWVTDVGRGAEPIIDQQWYINIYNQSANKYQTCSLDYEYFLKNSIPY